MPPAPAGAASGLGAMAAAAQLCGTDNDPTDAALPNSAEIADPGPARKGPGRKAAEPSAETSDSTSAPTGVDASVPDVPSGSTTELRDDITDIDELMAEA